MFRKLIMKNTRIADDDIARADIVAFIADDIGAGAGAYIQKFHTVIMIVKNPGMLAESDGNIAGGQKTGNASFFERS